ncbi:MAG: flagellar hook-associated protein 1 [Micromonosporaceae bacterium]|nr:flagellar hook-associated protein 1 [Micromonosporaceae bacterium]
MSTFSGLSTALSSLYAQRRGLDVTGQNIANANTEGYSRQRVDMASVGAPAGPALFSNWQGTGSGVTVSDVNRLYDDFTETSVRAEHAKGGYLTAQKGVYAQVEQIFNEPSDTGVQEQMSDLWSAFGDVANRPGDLPARSQLLQRASTLADTLKGANDSVGAMWASARSDVDSMAGEVNTTAASIARINQGVVQAQQAGLPSNELADQRDQMVLRLSELTGATAKVREDGAVDVYIGGSALVSGSTYRQVAAVGAHRIEDQAADPVSLNWADNKAPMLIQSGKAASVLESLSTTLPNTITSLNQVASALVTTVNDQHVQGFDLNGAQGGPLFSGSTAADIAVAITDPALVAASSSDSEHLDAGNADAMAGLVNSDNGPDSIYRGVVVQVGVDAQAINRRSDVQATMTTDIDSVRSSQSGVSLDEEMANLLSYQRAYEAASRVLTTVDSTLDTLINKMG